MSAPRIAICGWCPTELPDDPLEVQSHFLAKHGQAVDHSVRFMYPGNLDRDWAQFNRRRDARAALGGSVDV
jgi:hypothetical protein